jgi:F0F1-type ATP synthase assembly protein I
MRETIGSVALIIQLGTTVVVATMLPLLVGLWLDRQLNTMPWITLLGIAIGIIAAVVAVYDTITSLYKKNS